jgi:hypothetical protein
MGDKGKRGGDAAETGRVARIFPEYYDLTLPPNIAPLNFILEEPGSRFRIGISSAAGNPIKIRQRSKAIRIPVTRWRKLLMENPGEELRLEIFARHNHRWNSYTPVRHRIAAEPIDPYLTYRLVHATYLTWRKMGIYQRNLSNFDERPVIENASTGYGCINCHAFSNNDPSRMLIHFRILNPGTLIWRNVDLTKVDTRTPNSLSAGIYPAWHPDGNHIAFSTGKIIPHLTSRDNKVVDVADQASDLVVYDITNNTVTSSPAISTPLRENMPVWSPDGRHLYFIRAPEAVTGDREILLHSRYSLMRVAFNPGLNTWGEPETVLSSDSTGMSISMPSVSPDGRYLVCSMSDYGYFTIFHRGSDLYCVDLETNGYKKLGLNSETAESWSAWSSNGRWLVFSSKRTDGVYSRPHIAYFDKYGNAHTPFLLPQRDPRMYDRLLANYNLPKLVTGKIGLRPAEIRDAVLGPARKVKQVY